MKIRTFVVFALVFTLLGVSAGLYLAVRARATGRVEQNFFSYVEGLSETGYLVLTQGRERLTVRESAKGQLFGDTRLGDLLNIRSDATVELSAWAELSWAVDLSDTTRWSLRWNRDAGTLFVAAPPLQTLTPALRTETLEARVLDRSIFLSEKKMIESVRSELTRRFEEMARKTSEEPDVRSRAASALSAIALAFSRKYGMGIDSVEVVFGLEE